MGAKLTTNEFVERANKIHNNFYGYSKVNYINTKIKVIIICGKHGEFEQTPSNHLKGYKCLECGREDANKKQRMTLAEFVKRARSIHFNKYDYSESDYKSALVKIKIICELHGEFWQTPSHHINNGRGCPKCANENKSKNLRSTRSRFIERSEMAHNKKYDYSVFKYINAKIKGVIICPIHGKFEQNPDAHLNRRHGCPKCGGSEKKTIEDFIRQSKKVQVDTYDYSKFKYTNAFTKGIIICEKHGEFKQTPDSHLRGSGCPKCFGRISKAETAWLNEIEKNEVIKIGRQKYVYYYKNNNKKFLKVDGFCKKTNTCYEYNGYYWHGHPDYYNPYDIHPVVKTKTFGELYQNTLEKEKLIKQIGYNLIVKWG